MAVRSGLRDWKKEDRLNFGLHLHVALRNSQNLSANIK